MYPYLTLLLLASIGIISASPLEVTSDAGIAIDLVKHRDLTQDDGVVDLELLRGQLERVQTKYLNNFKRYESNTGEEHALAGKFFANQPEPRKRATASNALIDYGDSAWYGNVNVGTPAKTYTALFDTGSSDFFLPSPSCSTCGKHNTYNTSSSSTSRSLGKKFSLSYGDGSASVSGTLYNDTVGIGSLSVKGQVLGSATSYSSVLVNVPFDGVMGLGWPALSAYPATPFVSNLYNQGSLSSGSFSLKLAKTGSSLYLGGADSTLYTGAFSYTPVAQKAYWQVTAQAIKVGTTTIASNQPAIVDSGTTLLYIDSASAKSLYAKIPGAALASSLGSGIYSLPCSSIPNNTAVVLGGKTVTISSTALNAGAVSRGSTTCVGGIAAGDFGFWVLGDVFMRNVYTQFDIANARVGIATLR